MGYAAVCTPGMGSSSGSSTIGVSHVPSGWCPCWCDAMFEYVYCCVRCGSGCGGRRRFQLI